MQFVYETKQDPNDSVKSEVFWRPELLKMIALEPNIKKHDMYHLGLNDNSVYLTVGTLYSNDMNYKGTTALSKDDMDVIHKAMRTDLVKVIDKYDSFLAKRIYTTPQPFIHQSKSPEYWKTVAKSLFYIKEPIAISQDMGVFKISIRDPSE